ncbi:MAG: hypothetical protein LBP95_00140 [Deltaproteobacteria bacterium]|jgi:uncharacterized protein YfaS (alpha-2-macroglobulin family)|nr:hypothetical protein [Deltaproteobacteria bacterium]
MPKLNILTLSCGLLLALLAFAACGDSASETSPSAGNPAGTQSAAPSEEAPAETAPASAETPAAGTGDAAPVAAAEATPPDASQSAPLPEKGTGLKVLQFIPNGRAARLTQVAVMFNQPMVALGDYQNVDPGALTFSRELAGSLRWLNQYCLAFLPEKPLLGSLDVDVTLAAGIAALSGDVLEEAQSVHISLPKLNVVSAYEIARGVEEPLKPVWVVNFNQAPNLDSLAGSAFFVSDDEDEATFKIPAVPTPAEYNTGLDGFFEVSFKAAEDLPKDTAYRLVVEAGLLSEAGPEPLEADLVALAGRTYGPLEPSVWTSDVQQSLRDVARLGTRVFLENPDDYIAINFNNPVDLAEILDKIESTPPLPSLDAYKKRHLPKPPENAGQTPAEGQARAAADGDQTDAAADADSEDRAADAGSGDPDEEAAEDDGAEGTYVTTSLSLWDYLKSNTTYTVTIRPGLKDIYGQVTTEERTLSFTTGRYEPRVGLETDSGLMETRTTPIIAATAVNTSRFRVAGHALDQEQALAFLNLTGTSFTYTYPRDSKQALDFLSDAGTLRQMEVQVPGGAVDGPATVPVDLRKLFGDDLAGKLLVVYLQDQPYFHFSMFQITDLGFTAKIGRTAGVAWTTDMTTGRGLPGVALEVVSGAGRTLFSGTTGEDGLLRLPGGLELTASPGGPEGANKTVPADMESGPAAVYVVAKKDGQMTFWSLGWDFYAYRYDASRDGPLQWPFGPNPSLGFLLSAQPLYKPGETMRLKLIAREAEGEELAAPKSRQVKVVLADPFLNIVSERQLPVSDFGTISFDYEIPGDGRLGDFSVFLASDPETKVGADSPHPYLYSNPGLSFYGHVKVENFVAPAFDLEFVDLPSDMLDGESLTVAAKAGYHFGSPVADRPAEWSVTSTELGSFELPTLPGFRLVAETRELTDDDPEDEDHAEPSSLLLSGAGTLDAQGRARFPVTLTPAARPGPRVLTFHMGAQDVDSRSVFKARSLTAHPAELYAGLKARNFLARAGEEQQFDLAAADREGKLVAREVRLTLFRRDWTSARRRGAGGGYFAASSAADHAVGERTVTTAGGAASTVGFTPPRPGFYWLRARLTDDRGRLNETTTSFYAFGDGDVGWRLPDGDSLVMIPDKTSYEPGDTAVILVQNPFPEAEALFTVERAGVGSSEVVRLSGQAPTFEVPITEADGPNLYVSATLSRGRVAEKPDKNNVDLGKPTIRRGYLNLKIPSNRDALTVEVTPDAGTYKPGDTVSLDLSVFNSEKTPHSDAEVALAVVDAPLVQMLGDDCYRPDRVFSADRPLGVVTSNPIVSLIGRRNIMFKGEAGPGGGGVLRAKALAEGQSAADAARLDFRNLAFFDPAVGLDEDGKATVSFKLPDNLTTFKVYAVATGRGRLTGTGETDILVTKDVLVRSSLPAYASLGDEFSAAVTVTNRTDRPGVAKVSVEAENAVLKNPSLTETELSLAPGESKEAGFPVATRNPGRATFNFSVAMGRDSDRAEYSIDVKPLNKLAAQASYLEIKAGSENVALKLPEGTDLTRGSLDVELAPSLAPVMSGPLDFLEAYPYECLEQLTSKAYASLVALRFRDRFGLVDDQAGGGAREDGPEDGKDRTPARLAVSSHRAKVERHLALLRRSSLEGGFSLWPGSAQYENRSPTLTAYVLEFLLDAGEAGFPVDDQFLTEVENFLFQFLNDPSDYLRGRVSPEASRSVAILAAAALSKAGGQVRSHLERLYQLRETLPAADLINLIRAIGYGSPSVERTEMLLDCLPRLYNFMSLSAGRAQVNEPRRSPWIWSDGRKLTSDALRALLLTAPHSDFVAGLVREVVVQAGRGTLRSTQSNVSALLAVGDYISFAETNGGKTDGDGKEDDNAPNLTVRAALGERVLAGALFKAFTDANARGSLPLDQVARETGGLSLTAEGEGTAWGAVTLNFAAAEPDLSGDSAGGLMLSRSYSVLRPEPGLPGQSGFVRGQVVKVTVTMLTPEARHDLVLEDRVPAGFETVNLDFRSEDQTLVPRENPEESDWRRGDNIWYDHKEFWPDKVAVFADFLSPGVYAFSYLVRPVTVGTYLVPGPTAEEMYAPEIYGRGPGQQVTVSAGQ